MKLINTLNIGHKTVIATALSLLTLALAPLMVSTAQAAGLPSVGTETAPARADYREPAQPDADSPDYRVAVDDIINISVVNFPALSSNQQTVLPDGAVSVPLLHRLTVVGMTTTEIEEVAEKRFSHYVVEPYVSVYVALRHKDKSIVFTGFLLHPGEMDYRRDLRVLDALGDFGGALPNGDLRHVTVTHTDGASEALDLSHPESKAGTPSDILMLPGDDVYVPELRDEYSVIGDVQHPGSYDFKENMTVLDALTSVGGATDSADLHHATLTRNGHDQTIDLSALLVSGDMTQNLILLPGDRLMLPEGNRIYVFGDVGRPGFYLCKTGDRILDALNGCGGPLAEADVKHLRLTHIDAAQSSAAVREINLDDFLVRGDLRADAALTAGDVVYVPTRTHKFELDDLWGAIGSIGGLAAGTSIIRR